MKLIKHLIIFLFLLNLNNILYAKDPSALINEIVDEAASILSSEDPVESKIIKLNAIAEGRVILTDLQLTGNLSDGIRYSCDMEDFFGPFTEKGWWNDPSITWYDKALHSKTDGQVTMPPLMTWIGAELGWSEDSAKRSRKKKSNVVNFNKFKNKDDKK